MGDEKLCKLVKKALLSKKNVVGVGRGCKHIDGKSTECSAIVVFVKKKERKNSLGVKDLIPQDLDGVPTDVIEIGEIQLLSNRTARSRPVLPGGSISHPQVSAGTFGALVKDKRTGSPLILSNNHVIANMEGDSRGRAKIGDPILQPGTYDGGRNPQDIIAHLHRYIDLRTESAQPRCGVASFVEKTVNIFFRTLLPNYQMRFLRKSDIANLVDAAVAKPVSDDLISGNIIDLGMPTGVTEVQVGQEVFKSGRSSGTTRGEILALDVSISINMGEIGNARFEDQIMATAMSQPGDSGSMVLDAKKHAVGLLFAGSAQATVINRIQNVFRLLDISL